MKKSITTQAPSLLLLIVLVGFPQISETIFTPSLPDIASDFETTLGTVQLTLSIYFLAFALGVFCWGIVSDFIGRRPAILYGVILYGIGSFLCFQAKSIEFLLAARFMQAFGASTGSVVTQTILRENTNGLRRHTLFAQISAALAFTPAIGPLIGGVVDQFWGFRAVFFVLVIMSLFVFSYAYFSLGETYDVKQRSKVKLLPIVNRFLKNQPTLIYGFLIGTINGILFSYYAEAPFIFIEYFHFSTATYGFLGMIVAVASILGSLLSKRLVTTRQPEKIILDGIKIMLVGISIILAVSVSTFFTSEWQWFMLLVGVFITLLGTGTALPNCLSLALVDFQDVIGSAGGLFSLGYYLLVSVVTFGMSFVHNGTLWAMPCYFLLIGLIMLKLAKKLTNN
ncbi:multidrug effflux MFS transporter [Carnobacterium divergens]|uniref:multidrug effflux MFS transporter n=1 Tax=Carnobacterium divergens TaxID=2748 RepID=UPI001071C59E|nr:multidrug effflux MFS transporter [Carnobacterium divergens]MDT1995052.1 multidrug effflux MFS transporter [Carnobacterium divergens]TFI64209.1 Bcr/CflA family drug resistance efflux transporter [Carnobacterium divergens]TFI64452.1 Bcr/CflA family drug resistance efflux transporter [Carnobacterium divergens]TFI67422.1 Bcr/CflA family drug resistance efflux transporter [Carnobacterium divergens]TFI79616.1 Bcr/CflA family drug resistance efflux transporter [Carnobacterium divergens]